MAAEIIIIEPDITKEENEENKKEVDRVLAKIVRDARLHGRELILE